MIVNWFSVLAAAPLMVLVVMVMVPELFRMPPPLPVPAELPWMVLPAIVKLP